jgi:hypothetical protein
VVCVGDVAVPELLEGPKGRQRVGMVLSKYPSPVPQNLLVLDRRLAPTALQGKDPGQFVMGGQGVVVLVAE